MKSLRHCLIVASRTFLWLWTGPTFGWQTSLRTLASSATAWEKKTTVTQKKETDVFQEGNKTETNETTYYLKCRAAHRWCKPASKNGFDNEVV